MRGIYRLHDGSIVPVDVSGTAAGTFHALSSMEDVLWSVGAKDAIAFDGSHWMRID